MRANDAKMAKCFFKKLQYSYEAFCSNRRLITLSAFLNTIFKRLLHLNTLLLIISPCIFLLLGLNQLANCLRASNFLNASEYIFSLNCFESLQLIYIFKINCKENSIQGFFELFHKSVDKAQGSCKLKP